MTMVQKNSDHIFINIDNMHGLETMIESFVSIEIKAEIQI